MKRKLVFAMLLCGILAALYGGDEKDLGIRTSFSGSLVTGVGVYVSDGEDTEGIKAEPQIAAYNHTEGVGLRLELNSAVENVQQTAGVLFQLWLDDSGSIKTGDYVQAYLKLFDEKLAIWGGDLDDDTFATMGGLDGDFSDGVGFHVMAKPVDGLDIGAGVFPGAYAKMVSANITSIWNYQARAPGMTGLDLGDAQYTVQAAYTLPGIFRVAAGMNTSHTAHQSGTQIDYLPYQGYAKVNVYARDDMTFRTGINILALNRFGFSRLAVDGQYTMLAYYRDHERVENPAWKDRLTGRLWFGERIDWGTGPFSISFRGRHAFLFGTITEDSYAGYYDDEVFYSPVSRLNLSASWKTGNIITVNLDGGYLLGGYLYRVMRKDEWEWDLLNGGCFNKNFSAWYVQPGTAFSLGELGVIDVSFGVYGRDDASGGDPLDGRETLVYGVAVDYKVSF
jgi:hypothetical protein